jgi:hypothetical protein
MLGSIWSHPLPRTVLVLVGESALARIEGLYEGRGATQQVAGPGVDRLGMVGPHRSHSRTKLRILNLNPQLWVWLRAFWRQLHSKNLIFWWDWCSNGQGLDLGMGVGEYTDLGTAQVVWRWSKQCGVHDMETGRNMQQGASGWSELNKIEGHFWFIGNGKIGTEKWTTREASVWQGIGADAFHWNLLSAQRPPLTSSGDLSVDNSNRGLVFCWVWNSWQQRNES